MTKLKVFVGLVASIVGVVLIPASAFANVEKSEGARLTQVKNPQTGQMVSVVEIDGKLYATYGGIGGDTASFRFTAPLCRRNAHKEAKAKALRLCRRSGGHDCRTFSSRTAAHREADGVSWGCHSFVYVYDFAHPVDESNPVSIFR